MDVNYLMIYPNIDLDFFHVENRNENTKNIFVDKYIPVLNNNSKALLTFEEGYNLQGITNEALGFTFSIYKTNEENNELELVSQLNEGSLSLVDYNVSNQHNYQYYIFKEDSDYTSAACVTNTIKTCWWDWSITGLTREDPTSNIYKVDKNDVWMFNLNIESADITRTFNKTQYNNLTKFPTISEGELNFASGSISCILGNIRNDSYYEPASLLNNWNEFCTNKQLKLLKDRKGNKFIVEIMGSSTKTMDETQEQVNVLTFNWVQVDDTKGMVIIGG